MAEVNGNHANGAANGTNGFVKKPVVDISVALSPNNLPAVPDILKGISSLSTATINGDDQSRLELVEKARQLVRALETPRETMIKHCWAQVRLSRHRISCALTSKTKLAKSLVRLAL